MRSPWWFTLLAAVIAAVFSSMAAAVDIPTTTSSPAPAPAAPVPDTAQAPQPSASAPAPAAAPVTLRIGSFGAVVRDLQRELRRRGQRYVKVDGAFGPATRKAVKAVQRRLRMRPTGVATPAFLKRLGIQTSRAAGGTPVPAGLTQPVTLGAKYLRTFPVLGKYTYSDDFGAPRHQGRHEGNDIMADRGTPIVAVADGTIKRLTRTETGLGGIYVWLKDTAGNEYYYAHMDTIAAGLDADSAVRAGQVIGTVGNTGDARYGACHLHFEIHPGGGGAVDPFNDLSAVDPAKAR
ncbi:MAG: peptidoglycan DD-metalloendopeptidase family protein [Thermoleophilia bacterium]